ncbi:MAG: homoserine kinase [Campylobacteraceae bacterium]
MYIKIPATSANLGPGFDSLGVALSLCNEVKIEHGSYTSISIKGEGSDKPRFKKNNTFVNIFYEIYQELVGKKDNFRFEFVNNIPFSRGLGSSSSVVVGAIASAYHMAELKVDKDVVVSKALAFESHPDNITPAAFGGFISAVIHEGRVYKVKKEMPKDVCAVVVVPNTPMSTEHSRTLLPKQYKMSETVFNVSHSSLLSAAFVSENWELLKIASMDKMHEDLRMQALPELFDVRKIAYENGAFSSTLSGSGSSFLNITCKENSSKLAKVLKNSFKEFKILELEFDNLGFEITKS